MQSDTLKLTSAARVCWVKTKPRIKQSENASFIDLIGFVTGAMLPNALTNFKGKKILGEGCRGGMTNPRIKVER